MTRLLLALVLLPACAPQDPALVDEPTDDVAPDWGDAAHCPAFASGTVEIEVDGVVRTLEVELPDDPQGAPVLFAWHWLNGTATQTLDWMGVRDLAQQGVVVIAPESGGSDFEWDFLTVQGNNDLALFDAVLPCLWDQQQVDPDAVFVTGMSAGGLMTTWLTMHRADVLAGTAPFSGGADASFYTSPAEPIPVMVTWGGPTDGYGGYDFDAASRAFIGLLEADAVPVTACEHSAGHLPPTEAVDMLDVFIAEHRKGDGSAWQDGLPAELPEWCE